MLGMVALPVINTIVTDKADTAVLRRTAADRAVFSGPGLVGGSISIEVIGDSIGRHEAHKRISARVLLAPKQQALQVSVGRC